VSDATFWKPVVYPLKMCVPVAAVLLFVQGISEFLKSIHAAVTGEWL
jgi:TRAP-type mannitol/chloroaromatic compound transport system permease small subunit